MKKGHTIVSLMIGLTDALICYLLSLVPVVHCPAPSFRLLCLCIDRDGHCRDRYSDHHTFLRVQKPVEHSEFQDQRLERNYSVRQRELKQ